MDGIQLTKELTSPIFVSGAPRSGTTLLCQVLNSHSKLYIHNEVGKFFYEQLRNSTVDTNSFQEFLLDRLKLYAPILRSTSSFSKEDLVLCTYEVMCHHLRKIGKMYWGIKDPESTNHLTLLLRKFPDSRFIIIRRDPRATTASALKRRFVIANSFSGARQWNKAIEAQERFSERNDRICHWIKYENFLKDIKKETLKVCNFLEVEFEDKMLSYYKDKPNFKVHTGNINVMAPPKLGRIDAWASFLSRRQVRIIESVVWEEMRRHGYKPISRNRPRTSQIERLMYSLHQEIIERYWWQKRSGWSGFKKRLGLSLPKNHFQ